MHQKIAVTVLQKLYFFNTVHVFAMFRECLLSAISCWPPTWLIEYVFLSSTVVLGTVVVRADQTCRMCHRHRGLGSGFLSSSPLFQRRECRGCAGPTTNGGMQNGSSVRMCTHCTHVFARLAQIRTLSRCLLTKSLHRSSVGSLLRLRCWLGCVY